MSGDPGSWELAVELRPWQVGALQEWLKHRRGIVSVATGAGKTIFAERCMIEFFAQFRTGQVLILVPTIALLDQWFTALTVDLGVDPSTIAVFSGQERSREPGTINLAVLNTARRLAPIVGSSGGPAMLIVDECHRAATPQNSKALTGHYAAALGLSATPERAYDEGLETYVEPVVGPIIYQYPYQQALADGVLSPVKMVNVRIDLLTSERERYDRLSARIAREFSQSANRDQDVLRNLLIRRASVATNAVMRVPVTVRIVDGERQKRCIVFHESVRAANLIAKNLKVRGHRVGVYHTGLGPPLRRSNLSLFRRGILDVLVTCRALDEGIDIPEASVAVIASGSASERQRVQRLGRVLRPAYGKTDATIYTLYATDVETRRLQAEAEALGGVSNVTWIKSGMSASR